MSSITVPRARPSGRRPRAGISIAALACAAVLVPAPAAPAAVTTGPVDPNSGFPFSYTDDLGTSLQLCQDVSGFCVETPRPDQTQPISVPENFTPDEEGFWWLADATIDVPGAARPGLARFAKEAAFDTAGINAGHQVSFSRIRFRFTNPYGVDEIEAEPDPATGGRINVTEDVGCLAAPCGAFAQPAGDRVTGFLTWDPTVPPAAPAGYVGNGVTPHAVIGSPTDTNFVRLERLNRPAAARSRSWWARPTSSSSRASGPGRPRRPHRTRSSAPPASASEAGRSAARAPSSRSPCPTTAPPRSPSRAPR